MSSFHRSRAGRVVADWPAAVRLARTWAWQLDRRHRVRGIRTRDGWQWMVERATPGAIRRRS